jgi:hypothetical protein
MIGRNRGENPGAEVAILRCNRGTG